MTVRLSYLNGLDARRMLKCEGRLLSFGYADVDLNHTINATLEYQCGKMLVYHVVVFHVADTFRMVSDESSGVRFLVPHHYETNVKAAGDISNASRARRLAQEAVTLSTSLPLSASSSVFVRCDEERLDVMKV